MKSLNVLSILTILSILLLSSCKKDEPEDPIIPNEEELITDLNYRLSPIGGGDVVVLRFSDLDGDGGLAPQITAGSLKANTTYSGYLELLNSTESPAENISDEVAEEAEEHQFFFFTDVPGLSISYDDSDADGNPIGLSSTLETGDIGAGVISITLRHEPDKTAANVSEGDISNAGGETDIEVSFEIEVE